MITQVVKSKEELEALVRYQLSSYDESNCQHTYKADELDTAIKAFFGYLGRKRYPMYIMVDFTYVYRGFDIDLISTLKAFSLSEIEKIKKELTRACTPK